MSDKQLRVLINGQEIGGITQLRGGKLRFSYDEDYRHELFPTPLSLSMPLTAAGHDDKAITPFLWGLLPDNEATLAQIGRRLGVSARNPFALIGAMGEDLQGAIQIVPPDHVSSLKKRGGVTFLSRAKLTKYFAELMRDPGATQFTEGGGQFSLAGAQRKKTLYLAGKRWGEPRGRTPSTHILKPNIDGYAGQVENEMFCLRLAYKLSLPAAKCWVESFGDLAVIVVERYDRERHEGPSRLALSDTGGVVTRIHQEDACQALKAHPATKYQRDGGPGMKDIMQLLSGSAKPSVDRDRFMRACVYNYVIAGTDAHAKNYGLLLSPGGEFRLAPLYDIASWLPYTKRRTDRRLAMSVGRYYRYDEILPRHWVREAGKCGYDPDRVLAHIADIIARLPDEAATLHRVVRREGLDTPELTALVDMLIDRVKTLAGAY